MEITYPYFVPVTVQEESQAGAARREAARMASTQGMDEHDIGRVSIVVTEAANNLLRHGRGGEILLRVTSSNTSVMDVLALDRGRGMQDVSVCLRDGYSTLGTPGTGMGAMHRMSDLFEVFSLPDDGTIVFCQVGKKEKLVTAASTRMELGVVCVPLAGETKCGDGWADYHNHTHSVYMVVDGLGHGPGASEAAEEAVLAFHRVAQCTNPLEILEEIHHSLRKTRGAAASIAAIDHVHRKVRFAGIGNVSGTVLSGSKNQNMVSHNGIVGHSAPRIQDFQYDWPAGATLVLFSDGIGSHWNLSKYPGLQTRSPIMSGAVLYRDCSRRRDDATVLVARERSGGGN